MTYLQAGTNLANAGQYQRSEQYLREAIRLDFKSATAHYELANTLVHLKRDKEAVTEYTICYQLDPFGPASGYCRKALATFHAPIPETGATGNDTKPGQGHEATATAPTQGVAADDVINQQTKGARATLKSDEDAKIKWILDTGERKARQIEAEARFQADAVMRNDQLPMDGIVLQTRVNPFYTQEQRQQEYDRIMKDGKERAQLERLAAKEKVEEYRQRFGKTDSTLDEAARNLQSQLRAKQVKGSAYLRKEGTGLFVRNYGSDAGPIPEVHPGVARVIPNQPPTAQDYQAAANMGRLKPDTFNGKPPGTSVRGAILKKDNGQ